MSSTTKTIIGIFAIIIALLCVPVVDAGFVARTTKLTAQSNNDGISNPITTTITTITSSLTDKVPSFLEAYWTDNTTTSTTSNNKLKKEVGPGEGVSTLAIVLVNRADQR